MYRAILLPLAKTDIREAAKWYNEHQYGLGRIFTNRIRKTIDYIRKNPKAVAVRYDNVRTAVLDTFPYMVHFAIDEANKTVVIFAILNTSRDPRIWKRENS